MAKKIVAETDKGGLTNKEITKGNKALDDLNAMQVKTKETYLAFGALWLKVRENCTPEGLNKNGKRKQADTKRMGAIRVEQFGDKIDAQTAAYAARMAEYWEAGYEGFMPLKQWQEENSPRASNPRPLVQAYIKAHKDSLEALKQDGDGDGDEGDGDKEPSVDAGKLILQAKQALTKLITAMNNKAFDKEKLGEINSMIKAFDKEFQAHLADGQMAKVEDNDKKAA